MGTVAMLVKIPDFLFFKQSLYTILFKTVFPLVKTKQGLPVQLVFPRDVQFSFQQNFFSLWMHLNRLKQDRLDSQTHQRQKETQNPQKEQDAQTSAHSNYIPKLVYISSVEFCARLNFIKDLQFLSSTITFVICIYKEQSPWTSIFTENTCRTLQFPIEAIEHQP